MYYRKTLCAQQENVDQGTLQITVHSKTDNRPVENALVRISYTGDPNSVIEEVRTDSSGNTPVLQLKTPPLEYSLNASEEAQPYAEYSMQIKAEDFHQEEIAGTEVLPAVLAKQPVLLNPRQDTVSENRIVIPPHTLFYEYPPKIQESEIKPVHETGEKFVYNAVDGVKDVSSADPFVVVGGGGGDGVVFPFIAVPLRVYPV